MCLCAGVGDTLQKRKSSGDGGNSHGSYWDSPPCEHITFPQFSQALDRSIIFTQITVYMSWLTFPLVPGIFSQAIPPHSKEHWKTDSLAACLCCVLIRASLFNVQSPRSTSYTRELNEEKKRKIPTQNTNCKVKLNAVNPPPAQLTVQRQQQGSETQVSYKWNILASFSSWLSFREYF